MKGLAATARTLQKEHRRVVKLLERGSLDIETEESRADLHRLLQSLLEAHELTVTCQKYERLWEE